MLTFLQRKIAGRVESKTQAALQKGLVSILKCVYRALDSCDFGGLGGGLMLLRGHQS